MAAGYGGSKAMVAVRLLWQQAMVAVGGGGGSKAIVAARYCGSRQQ